MKHFLFLLLAATLTLCGCTKQDLDEIRAEQAEIDARLSALEEWQKTVNTQIIGLQSLVLALDANDHVSSVSELSDGSGYVINFVKSGAVTIRNGSAGGSGTSGSTPNIGVKEDDGVYYWTLGGEYITDDSGNRLRVTGETGVKGDDALAPQVQINATSNEWEISTDGGAHWTTTGVKATGTDGVNGASCSIAVDSSSNHITVTITNTDANGNVATPTVIELPLYKALYIGADAESQKNSALIITKKTTEIPLVLPSDFTQSDYTAIMAQIISNKGTNADIQTRAATAAWTVAVTKPTFSSSDGSCNKDAKVTVTTPDGIKAGESALLEVTLVGNDGSKTVSTRALTSIVGAQPGYYYYSDGSISSEIVSGKTPIGIVFYVGDVAKDDEKLKAKLDGGNADNYSTDDIHGLVVALKDASSGVAWQKNYTLTNIGNTTTDKLCGYSNTLAMEAWNKIPSNSDNQITVYKTITDYARDHTAPANSSDWYLPSIRELSTLCSGWQDSWSVGGDYGGIYNNGFINTINNKLNALNNSNSGTADAFDAQYWSSSEYVGVTAFIVDMNDGYVGSGIKYLSSQVRVVLAF